MAETSKKRTVRIPLDYYKRPDRLSYWKLVLSAAAVLLAAGWASGFGWDFWSVSRWQARARGLASHGTLTRSHATWDSQCEACHAPFRPIGQATWVAPVLGDSSRSDAQCQGCHATPIHHQNQKPHDLACASCHHDHRGRDASLVRLADQHCTRCHSDLTAHMVEDRAPDFAATVTRFDADPNHHPEFRTTRNSDPGRLKFNHALHLRPGMASEGGGPVLILKMLREPDRARYQGYAQGAEGTIKLDCAACHQLARQDPVAPVQSGTAPTVGAYMLPITYENQCRACHRLDYDPAARSLEMAHPLQPAEVHASLDETYAAEFLRDDPALLDQHIGPKPAPGKDTPDGRVEARQAITRKIDNAEKILFGAKKCGECHSYETADNKPVEFLERWDPAKTVRTTPTNVPAVWWRSAAFDHTAHRSVDCRACHERAFPDSLNASQQSKDVLLPAIKVCLECHGPRRDGSAAALVSGGADFDCTECHRYHNGAATLKGLAATPSAAGNRAPIRQFLLGTPTSSRP